ncbi:hypothetical protein [Nocardia sp. GAS34]|uniref:hypothetical protein n=1 Tax=unclassified Nocardia TaxID=2637762 RepID=UPI003D228492
MSEDRPRPDPIRYTAAGRIVPAGELVQLPDGRWVEPTPIRCPAGHSLIGPGRARVSWQPCATATRSGHRTHRCRTCDAVVFTPPLDPGCPCQDDRYRPSPQGAGSDRG